MDEREYQEQLQAAAELIIKAAQGIDAYKTVTDKVIETLAAPYWSLLQYEPIYNGASVYFVNILPHQYAAQMEVTERQYVFLEHIIHIYLKDSIDLTPFVRIKTVTT